MRFQLSMPFLLAGLFFSVAVTRAQNNASLQESIQKTLDTVIVHIYDDPDRSVETAEQALEQSLANRFKKQELRSYYCLGLAYYHKGYFLVSNDYYRLITQDPEAGAKERSAAWNNMGINFEMLRRFDSSLYAYQRSLEIDQNLGDLKSEHMVLINMGLLNFHLHRQDLAFSQTRKAFAYFSKTGDLKNMALCYMNFAIYHEEMGNRDSALVYNILAEEIYTKLGDVPNMVLMYNNQINLFLGLKNMAKAKEVYRRSQVLSPKVNSPYHTATLHAMASNLFSQTGEFDSAIVHSLEAIRLYKELGVAEYVVRETFYLARTYAEAGRIPEFKKTISQYDSLNIELNVKELANRLAEVEVKYKLESKNREIKMSNERLSEQRRFIILISVFSLFLLLALIKTYSLYSEVKKANRHLYRKNIELMERETPAEETTVNEETPEPEESGLLVKFRKVMLEKELYKNPDLSLRSASQELGTNEKYLSQAINAGGGDNFNTFINRFRVNEARRIILEKKHNDASMEELALMVGFTNRHTFSRAFTQIAGISPSVFKKIHLSGREEKKPLG